MAPMHRLHDAEAVVVPAVGCNERRSGGCGGHGIDFGEVEPADDLPKRADDVAVMKHPGSFNDFPLGIDFSYMNGNGADVDPEEMRRNTHSCFLFRLYLLRLDGVPAPPVRQAN